MTKHWNPEMKSNFSSTALSALAALSLSSQTALAQSFDSVRLQRTVRLRLAGRDRAQRHGHATRRDPGGPDGHRHCLRRAGGRRGGRGHRSAFAANVRRSRPVVLTAAVAVFAMVPLAGSVFWGAMAIAIMGGLIVVTVLTLAFVPALYAAWFRMGRGSAPAPQAAIPEPQST
jgi:AcrB/AcrD/AcrF family